MSDFSLSVNSKDVIKGVYPEPLHLKDVDLLTVIDSVISIDEIKGYNITFKIEKKDGLCDYGKNWKSVGYVFWSGKDPGDKYDLDSTKYGKFEWTTVGERESFDANGIASKLDNSWESPGKNFFSIDNIGDVMDYLIELDILLDKQHNEKELLYNKMKMELPK